MDWSMFHTMRAVEKILDNPALTDTVLVDLGGAEQINILLTVSEILQARFEQTQSDNDFQHAITLAEKTLASISNDHPSRALYVNNFATTFESRFRQTQQIEYLDSAITTFMMAAETSAKGDPNVAAFVKHNLSDALIDD